MRALAWGKINPQDGATQMVSGVFFQPLHHYLSKSRQYLLAAHVDGKGAVCCSSNVVAL